MFRVLDFNSWIVSVCSFFLVPGIAEAVLNPDRPSAFGKRFSSDVTGDGPNASQHFEVYSAGEIEAAGTQYKKQQLAFINLYVRRASVGPKRSVDYHVKQAKEVWKSDYADKESRRVPKEKADLLGEYMSPLEDDPIARERPPALSKTQSQSSMFSLFGPALAETPKSRSIDARSRRETPQSTPVSGRTKVNKPNQISPAPDATGGIRTQREQNETRQRLFAVSPQSHLDGCAVTPDGGTKKDRLVRRSLSLQDRTGRLAVPVDLPGSTVTTDGGTEEEGRVRGSLPLQEHWMPQGTAPSANPLRTAPALMGGLSRLRVPYEEFVDNCSKLALLDASSKRTQRKSKFRTAVGCVKSFAHHTMELIKTVL